MSDEQWRRPDNVGDGFHYHVFEGDGRGGVEGDGLVIQFSEGITIGAGGGGGGTGISPPAPRSAEDVMANSVEFINSHLAGRTIERAEVRDTFPSSFIIVCTDGTVAVVTGEYDEAVVIHGEGAYS